MEADTRSLLLQSEASRRRAWEALQGIRTVLANARVIEIPATERPFRFEREGRVLALGLEQTLRRIETVMDELNAAVEAARPFLIGERRDGFAQVYLRLNRALSRATELLPLLPK
jgi:hypothetical protein